MAKPMTAQPPLRTLVDAIQEHYRLKGEEITLTMIGEKLRRNKDWLSSLLYREQLGAPIPDKTLMLLRKRTFLAGFLRRMGGEDFR